MIVADHTDAPQSSEPVLCWRGFAQPPGVTSIPRYLERHGERLRTEYLRFVHELGRLHIAGRSLVEHLADPDGFSFWWMTKLAEKSPFKSTRVYDCLRMLALRELLLEHKPSTLTLETSDRVLSDAIAALCESLQIAFTWSARAPRKGAWSLRTVYHALPFPLQGVASLRHLALRWPIRGFEKPAWFSGTDAVFLCSNFAHLDVAACAQGRFHSYQWEDLPACIRDTGRLANWVHHFLHRPSDVPASTGLSWMRLFNRDARAQGNHAYLETYLSWRLVARALKRWLRLNGVAWRLGRVGTAADRAAPARWLWPLLEDDWRDSLCGATAVTNCMWIELFDAVLRDVPEQKLGLYLWENQAWECALVRAWRKHGHGTLVGVPHSTVPFWYLNIYDDPRTLEAGDRRAKPIPDALAVNGRMAFEALTGTGYPRERLVEVEALRFQYLAAFPARANMAASASSPARETKSALRLLVLGDYSLKQTTKMIECVAGASRELGGKVTVTLKPHPTCLVDSRDFSPVQLQMTDRPLAEIVQRFDFAFCSNSTSAALDVLLAGVPVAIFLDDEDFNHSPLRGAADVTFVNGGEDLAQALRSVPRNAAPPPVETFFCLDSRLPRWRGLLTRGR